MCLCDCASVTDQDGSASLTELPMSEEDTALLVGELYRGGSVDSVYDGPYMG